MPAFTFTVPLLLNGALIVLVPVPPLFWNVPWLSNNAEAPLSALPKFCVNNEPSKLLLKVLPAKLRTTPAAATPVLVGFKLMLPALHVPPP